MRLAVPRQLIRGLHLVTVFALATGLCFSVSVVTADSMVEGNAPAPSYAGLTGSVLDDLHDSVSTGTRIGMVGHEELTTYVPSGSSDNRAGAAKTSSEHAITIADLTTSGLRGANDAHLVSAATADPTLGASIQNTVTAGQFGQDAVLALRSGLVLGEVTTSSQSGQLGTAAAPLAGPVSDVNIATGFASAMTDVTVGADEILVTIAPAGTGMVVFNYTGTGEVTLAAFSATVGLPDSVVQSRASRPDSPSTQLSVLPAKTFSHDVLSGMPQEQFQLAAATFVGFTKALLAQLGGVFIVPTASAYDGASSGPGSGGTMDPMVFWMLAVFCVMLLPVIVAGHVGPTHLYRRSGTSTDADHPAGT